MRICYDVETDSLTITLRDVKIKESDETQPGIIIDLGLDDNVVGVEIMQASEIVSNPQEMQFSVTQTGKPSAIRST